jgi:hypothetical protein
VATIKLPDRLLDNARIAANATHRSVPKQLEHWITLGKAAEDNPDLPLNFIRDTLEALAEIEAGGELTEFKFSQ